MEQSINVFEIDSDLENYKDILLLVKRMSLNYVKGR